MAAPTSGRRTALRLGAAAAVGAAAAAGGLWWRAARENHLHDATANVWLARFPTPAGGELAMSTLRGRGLVLNFWGTWCPPCVKEMPELDRFARAFGPRGWSVVGLAVDNVKPVQEFLARTPVSYAIGMAGFAGSELARRLGNTQGGLPFTVVFDADGYVAERKLGETHFGELSAWATRIGA
jgi:thiol-disulfide isomerase/thioredoxin